MGRLARSRNVALALCAVVVHAAPASGLDLSILWGRAKPEDTRPFRRLDPLSMGCVGCHGETVGGSKLSFVGSRIAGHPVGLAYQAAWQKNSRSLRAPLALHPSVALPGGRVTCLSCHVSRMAASTVSPSGSPGCPQSSGLTRPRRELCVECHLR